MSLSGTRPWIGPWFAKLRWTNEFSALSELPVAELGVILEMMYSRGEGGRKRITNYLYLYCTCKEEAGRGEIRDFDMMALHCIAPCIAS